MVKEWPPAVDTIVLFIAWLSLKGFKYSTARLYVNAIGFQCKMRNCLDISRNFAVQKALEGLHRSAGKCRLRLLITQTLLKAVIGALSSVCKNEYECRLFGAAYCLAFFALLRVGELVARNRIGAESVIMASDVIDLSAEGL